MVTDRYSLYNGNGQLMTNEGKLEEVAEFIYKQERDAQGN